MGNPRRFLGADHPIEIGGVTIPPRCAVEITFRAHQQRYLLRPDEDANEILLGCFGRAYHRYPELNVLILNTMSNHGSFIAAPESAFVMSSFMRDFLSTAAKRLNLQRGRNGTFWERRFRAIPILDDAALEERFRYVLTQGTKENLVWSARDWPGINCARALMGGPQLVGRWRDYTAEGELRKQRKRKIARAGARGRTLELPETPRVYREYPIELVPMPHWRDLKVGQRRARVAKMLREDDAATRARHERDGTRPLGVRAILATNPFDRPAEPKKSPAPPCHTTSPVLREAYDEQYRVFCDVVDRGKANVEASLPDNGVPLHGILPSLGHHPPLGPRRPDPPPVFVPPPARASRSTGPPAQAPPAS